MADQEKKQGAGNKRPEPMVERSKFGVPERRKDPVAEEFRPPVTSTELSKGPAELVEYPGPKVNWRVFIISAIIILAFSIWAIVVPDSAAASMRTAVSWISTNLGWFYVLTVTLVVLFVLWVAFSKEGSVRLGPDHSRPQYNLFTWVAMLFAAGVGIDMLFYSVTGPITQYITPPAADPQSAAAIQDAVVWTMFHYGIAGWAMYALLGMAMGYFAYRWGMPLSIRAALYPLLGKRVRGAAGDVIDIFALVGTVFGVATSMGIGVVLLNVGFSLLFGLPEGLALQIALVLVAVIMTIAACTSGVDKGIRLISELNLWSAGAMMLYILVTGHTSFLLTAMVENIGRFVFTLPERTLQTFAYQEGGADWMASWTLFFWAFWLAWGPFVGLFLARISRGRTLREFVIAAITAPVLCDFFIVSIFGNSAMEKVLGGNTEFANLAVESPEHGWYALLEMFPGAPFLIGLATLSGLLFYLTSANSGAMIMSNFSSSIPDPSVDGAKWLRIFWALVTAVLTVAMLVAGGVTTMEHATLIFALPVTIIAYLVMASFSKVLRMERAEREGTGPASEDRGGARRRGAGEDLAPALGAPACLPVQQGGGAIRGHRHPSRAGRGQGRVQATGLPGRFDHQAQCGDRHRREHVAGPHARPPQLPLPGGGGRGAGARFRCAHRGPRGRRVLPAGGVHADRHRGLRPDGPGQAAGHQRRAGPLRGPPVLPAVLVRATTWPRCSRPRRRRPA